MEITQKQIEEVVEYLLAEKFNGAMNKVSECFQIARKLMEKFPELTPEEIGQKYEEMCMQQNDKTEMIQDEK